MATRSLIAVRRGPNDTVSIYCHYDGYPGGVGSVLLRHYNSAEAAESIVALGDLSTLEEATDLCKKLSDPFSADSLPLLEKARRACAEYVYIYAEGQWHVCEANDDMTWKPLSGVIAC